MQKKALPWILGGSLALIVATAIAVWTINTMNNGREWCESHYANDPEGMRYCMAQVSQGPGWAIGFGFWFCLGAFFLGRWIGRRFAGASTTVVEEQQQRHEEPHP